MEDCDAVSEDTNQQRDSPSQGQSPPEQVSLAKDHLPSADDASSKQGVDNGIETIEMSASNGSVERPRSPKKRQHFQSSLETIVEDKITTSFLENVETPGKLVDQTSSPHDLRLAETTESMVVLTSQTSLHSLATTSSSMHTIFQTPDWAEDDSDNKLSQKTELPVKSSKRERSVNGEVASPTHEIVKGDVDSTTRDMNPVQTDGVTKGALPTNTGLPVEQFLEPRETFNMSHPDQLESVVQPVSGRNESDRSAIEELEHVPSDIREFDPLIAPVLLPTSLNYQTETQTEDPMNRNSDADICIAPCLAPIVLTPFLVLPNSDTLDLQKNPSTLQDNDDMIQFDNIQEKVILVEESGHSATTEPCNEAEKLDQVLKSLPSPPTRLPCDFQNSGQLELEKNLVQLKEYPDISRIEHTDAKTADTHSLPTMKDLKSPLNEDLILQEKLAPLPSTRLLMKVDDLEKSDEIDEKNGSQEQIPVPGEFLPEHPQRVNEPEIELQNIDILSQDIPDQISFNPFEEVTKSNRTTGNSAAQDIRQPVLSENDPATSASPTQAPYESAKSLCPERSHLVKRDCKDNSNTAPTPSQARNAEFEIDPIEASRDVHQIRSSCSSLLQDFYNMRKTYTDFSFGSQSITRTQAERDRPLSDLISFVDRRHRLGAEIEQQSKRIDSAINLMDATIEEIQKWQAKKMKPELKSATQATPASNDAATVSKVSDAKRKKPSEIVRSSTVSSTPAVGRDRLPNKSVPGNVLKRETHNTRVDTSRTVRPMTSHVPNRNQDVSAQGRGVKASVSARRDFLAGQEKQPTGDAKSSLVRLNTNFPTSKIHSSPSTRNVKTPAAKSARTLQSQTLADSLNELKKCTLSPASYLERCLALTQINVGKTQRQTPQQDNSKQAVFTKRTPVRPETPKKAVNAIKPNVVVPLSAASTKEGKISKVLKPKEISVPQTLVDFSNKDSNVACEVTDKPAVKEVAQENADTKPKNRFLSDEDIEKWVRLSTRYARCAEMGASLFQSKHSCRSDKESVKSDGSLVKTASDFLMDTLMDTVTSAVRKTSRAKVKPSTKKKPTTDAAKDILSRLSVGNTTCITKLKTEEKVTRSIDNLVRSMSKIVDATSDKRVCWDSSRDSMPVTLAGKDAGLDEVQEAIVEKSRQVVEKMTDTLIKHLSSQKDELDFKTADDIDPVTQISVGDLRKVQTSTESMKSWSDTKNNLEVILSRLITTNSSTSSWGLTSHDPDGIPESVKKSQHKLATLENIVALLNGINRTCKIRENNVEWDDPEYVHRTPSMAPLPEMGKRSQKSSNQGGSQRKNSSSATSGRKFISLSSLSTKSSPKSSARKKERLSYYDTSDEKFRNPPSTPKSEANSNHSAELNEQESRSRPTNQTSAQPRSPSARTLDSQRSASSSSRRFSYCDTCNDKARKSTEERDGKQHRRSASNALASSQTSKRSITRDHESRRPTSRLPDSSKDRDSSQETRFSYCETCNEKRRKAKRAAERGENTANPPKRASSFNRRDRSLSPTIRLPRGSSISSGSTDTCDEKRRKASLAKEFEDIEKKRPRTSEASTTIARSRSPGPSVGRWSSVSSASSVEDGASRKTRFSYCETCNEKRRKEALAKERGEVETKRPRPSASNTSAKSRSQSPPARRWSSVSSTSSVEDGASRKTRFSYCDTCDEKLRKQTPPATPLKNHGGGSAGSWRSDSSQGVKSAIRVSFSAPLKTVERGRESATSPRKESTRLPRQAPAQHPSSLTKELGRQTVKKEFDMRKTDSLLSHLSASLSRDSSSDNYSRATFIISGRPSRSSRVDLALPKIRHVEGTKSKYSHVLQKAFMDRLDNIIKVQTETMRPNLYAKPSATSNTSMARYTQKKTEVPSSSKQNTRHQIPSVNDIRSRMRKCCERMPTRDLYGAKINRESLVSKYSQRVSRESEQSFGFLDEVSDVEDFVWKSMTPTACNKAFSTTYADVIQRQRPFQATTKISRKIQSFIEQDLSSWHKITNDRIQSVKQDESFFPFTMSQSSVLESDSSTFNKSEESLLQALAMAIGGSPWTNPLLMPSIETNRIAKDTVKALRKNKKYRQRDTLDQDEVVIPIGNLCSSESLLRTINAVLKTDTEASLTPTESHSTTDVEHMTSDSNIDLVMKSMGISSSSQSIRNVEILSTSSTSDCEKDATATSTTECYHVVENVAKFSYTPSKYYSGSVSAMSSSDFEIKGIAKVGELPGAKSGDQELQNGSKCSEASSEGDMPSAENTAGPESVRMSTNIGHVCESTATFSTPQASKSIHSYSEQVQDHLFSRISEKSSESQHQYTNGEKEMKEDSFSTKKGDLINSSDEHGNDSFCSIPELLERYEMAIPFQHERLAIETNSGMSIPIVDAVSEDTLDKLAHAMSHLPQESRSSMGDEVFSRLHHPNIPHDVRADLDIYNECLDDETLYQNQKLDNRSRNTRDGIWSIRQTKSLLDEAVRETKVTKEVSFWSEDADGIVSASGDTDVNDQCSNSDGLSLIANVSTDVLVTDSTTDHSLNVSSTSTMTAQSSASTSRESLVTTSEDILNENDVLVSLLEQFNTRSQLNLLNSRLDGIVRREQLVDEVVEPLAVEWRGASTLSALFVTFGAVMFGAIMGLPNLWE